MSPHHLSLSTRMTRFLDIELRAPSIKRNGTLLLFGLAISTAFLSLVFGPMNVHNYCEDRPVVGVLACISALSLVLLVRNRGRKPWGRVISNLAILVCFLTTFGDVAFIWYARRCVATCWTASPVE